jgi:hypothetical protein
MVIIGILAVLMVTSSILVTAACMLSSQCSRTEEQPDWIAYDMADQLSGSPAAQQRKVEAY